MSSRLAKPLRNLCGTLRGFSPFQLVLLHCYRNEFGLLNMTYSQLHDVDCEGVVLRKVVR